MKFEKKRLLMTETESKFQKEEPNKEFTLASQATEHKSISSAGAAADKAIALPVAVGEAWNCSATKASTLQIWGATIDRARLLKWA